MKREHAFTVMILLVLWQGLSMVVSNDILIPYPFEVFASLISLVSESNFYTIIFTTLIRVLDGFLLSLLLGLILSILSERFIIFRNLFEPIQVLTKTIPNVSYIIIALIWLGPEKSVTAICFLVLFPIFYNNFLFAMDSEDIELKDVEKIYPESFWELTKIKTLPMLIPSILVSSKTAFGLGFKVSVMAEILGQVRIGIGKQLYLARINLDTTSLFAWTIVIILICFIIDWVFNRLINKNLNGG